MKKKWIQGSVKKMKKKGTIGSFRECCGGKVTLVCVDRALHSKSTKRKKQAQWFLNVNKNRLHKLK